MVVRATLVVEAPSDACTVAILVDLVLVAKSPDWVDQALLPSLRHWRGLNDGHAVSCGPQLEVGYSLWTETRRLWQQRSGPRFLGHGPDGPVNEPYAAAARRVIQMALQSQPDSRTNALVLVVDADTQANREVGLRAAVRTESPTFPVVVGVANKKREAWVLNAFEPRNQHEKRTLNELTRRLSFNPLDEAHRLRGGERSGTADRDAKQVLAELTRRDRERELDALRSCELDRLDQRGTGTGLAAFLADAERLVTLFEREPDW